MTQPPNEQRASDRRRTDWQQNDRRQSWPWVMDINDRRSGLDRRLEERRAQEIRAQEIRAQEIRAQEIRAQEIRAQERRASH